MYAAAAEWVFLGVGLQAVRERPLALSATALAALVGLAACGGGSSKPSSAGAEPGATFSTADVPGVGTVVVDGRGHTVYVLTSAKTKNVPCTDDSGCTKVWPDLSLPDGTSAAKAGAGLQSALLGTQKVGDETYPTYNGWLLYEYSGDSGKAQGNGQGITSYGGTWYALTVAGDPVKDASSSPSGTSSGGSGYYP